MGSRLSRIAWVAAAGLMLACAAFGAAEKPQPFTPGETLTYDVTWAVFSAGKVTATFLGPGSNPAAGDQIATTARSQGFVSLLFSVQDTFHSSFDPSTLCSRGISKVVNEGSRHKEAEIAFDYARHVAVLNEHDPTRSNAPTKHQENSIPACVEDVITAFYYVRRQPLETGHSVRLAINDGGKTTEVTVEVEGREPVRTGLGTRQAVRVEPKVFGQLYKRKGRMWVWFSDDAERLPLVIKVSLGIGTLTGRLKSVTRTPPPAQAEQR